MRSFTISTDYTSPRRWCWVRIHDTVEDLRAAKTKLNPVSADPTVDAETWACWQPTSYEVDEDSAKVWPSNGYAGLVRLAEGHITSEIVAHELVHAAAAIYRMNVAPSIRLGKDVGIREEEFAYICGELYSSFEEGWHAA
jgi:hypothetical protein